MARFGALFVAGASAASFTNCGSDSDHLKVDLISLDADATGGPRKGTPFTLTATGTLDEAHLQGTVVVDANLKALGIVSEPVQATQAYEISPGLASGAASITVGPFAFPTNIPGEFDFTGRVSVMNEKSEPVACIDVAFNIPKATAEEVALKTQTQCATASTDHISNIVTDGATTTMDLDEDLNFVDASVDISVQAPIVPAVAVQLDSLPIAFSPTIPAGKLTFIDKNVAAPLRASDITVSGSIKLSDKNGEQWTCISLDAAESAVSV